MRYLIVTYLRQAGGRIDEQVGFSKRLKNNDLQTCNIILDYQDRSVLKCTIEGKKLERTFESLNEYYKSVYTNMIEQLEKMNQQHETKEGKTDGQ